MMRLFSSLRVPTLSRRRLLHVLLLLAPDHFPALELGKRPALLDPHHVADRVGIGLVVGVILLRAANGLLHGRVREAALHTDDHGLVLFVADDNALQRTLRHGSNPYFLAAAPPSAARFWAATVFMRAMSRRMARTREVFSSWPVARWKRRLNCSFFSLRTSSSS